MKSVLCETCGLKKKYGANKICNSCIHKNRTDTPKKRKELKNKQRINYLKRKGLPLNHIFPEKLPNCEICKKEIDDNKRWSRSQCQSCGARENRKKKKELNFYKNILEKYGYKVLKE